MALQMGFLPTTVKKKAIKRFETDSLRRRSGFSLNLIIEKLMIPSFRTALGLLCLVISVPALGSTYHLQTDLGVRGLMRHCKYSNGKVYTVNATDVCPISVEDSPPRFGQGHGFLKGEYQDGMTKVCVYDVLGERRAVRLPSTSLCPLNQQF